MRRSFTRAAVALVATTLTAVLTVGAGPVAEAGPTPDTRERAVSVLTARLLSGNVQQNEKLLITGRLVGDVDRPILIQQHARNGTWVTLAETRPTADGSFSVEAPTWWVATQTLRAFAPGTANDLPALSMVATVTVTSNDRPRGGSAFALNQENGHWNPCRGPLTYRISDRVTSARIPLRSMAAKAFAQVSAATGFRFVDGGSTHHIPFSKRGAYPSDTDFLLGWVDPSTTNISVRNWRNAAGYGGARYFGSSAYSGLVAGEGTVGLNADGLTRWKHMTKHDWMIVLMHEIGHAIGLAHVEDERQIMSPGSYDIDTEYGTGDLRGFEKIGADAGCIGTDSATRSPLGHDDGRTGGSDIHYLR